MSWQNPQSPIRISNQIPSLGRTITTMTTTTMSVKIGISKVVILMVTSPIPRSRICLLRVPQVSPSQAHHGQSRFMCHFRRTMQVQASCAPSCKLEALRLRSFGCLTMKDRLNQMHGHLHPLRVYQVCTKQVLRVLIF